MIKIEPSGVKNKPFIVTQGGYIELSNGDEMYIPKGYTFDNGSIPKIFKWIYDLTGWSFLNYKGKEFLVHDFLYNYRGYQLSQKIVFKPISRSFADDELAYQMLIRNESRWLSCLVGCFMVKYRYAINKS